jgi:hypothetical protein
MERQILPSGEKAMATGISRTPPMEVIPLSNWETSMISWSTHKSLLKNSFFQADQKCPDARRPKS